MKLTKEQIIILCHLLLSEGYTSSHRLSGLTGLSRRKVLEEMKMIKRYCAKQGVQFISSSSKGFMLDRKTLEDAFIRNVFQQRIEAKEEDVTAENYRQNIIMSELIRRKDYVKEKELAEKMYLSESTVAKEMSKCRARLKRRNLKLEHKPYYGLKVTGSEIDKRRELTNYFMTDLKVNNSIYDFMDTFTDSPNSIPNRIYNYLLEHHLYFTDFQICDFFIILAVTIERIKEGFVIEEDVDLSYGYSKIRSMIPIAQKIACWLEQGYGCVFDEKEIRLLAIELICRSTLTDTDQECSPEYYQMCREILDEIYRETHIQLDDPGFIRKMAVEAEFLIFRNHYHERNRTPLYRSAAEIYPLGFQLAQLTLQKIGQRYEAIDSRSELFHMTVMFDAEIHKTTDKIRTLLLSSYDSSYTELIRNKLQYHFYYDLNITDTCSYYEFMQKDLTRYDMIISTFQPHRNTSIPCIAITAKCTEEDMGLLRYIIDHDFYRKRLQFCFLPFLYRDHVILKNRTELAKYINDLIRNSFSSVHTITADMIQTYMGGMEMFNRIGLLRLPLFLGGDPAAFPLILEDDMQISGSAVRIVVVYLGDQNKTNLPDLIQIQLKRMSEQEDELDRLIKDTNYFDFMDLLVS